MNKIGFHARSMEELLRVTSIPGIDLVELKPEKFLNKDGEKGAIYLFDGKRFIINHHIVAGIRDICLERGENGITAQIHLPLEKKVDPSVENGLCQAEPKHHDLLLARYEMFGEMLERYGIGTVLTVHPPSIRFNGRDIFTVRQALDAGRDLYARLDRLMKEKGLRFDVGIENTVMPKKSGTNSVGYNAKQIDEMIGDTSRIGITYDTGHRMLNNEMSAAELFRYAKIVNVHFHSNPGLVSEDDYDDDRHELAIQGNLRHYKRHLKGMRRQGMPVVLEIGDLKSLSDEVLTAYVKKLRRRLEEGVK